MNEYTVEEFVKDTLITTGVVSQDTLNLAYGILGGSEREVLEAVVWYLFANRTLEDFLETARAYGYVYE